jgi:UDP-2,3-diacylglucosamine hydrolase
MSRTDQKGLFIMTIMLISDIHLQENSPTITDLFLKFIQNEAVKCDKLIILGDLFEVWVGDDHQDSYNHRIIQTLRKSSNQGLTIEIMRGNRDFLLGKQFQSETGCTLLPDFTTLTLNKTPTLLLHGDTLCSDDTAYQRFRRITRNPASQFLFSKLPLKQRQKIVNNIRQKSKTHIKNVALDTMDVTQETVDKTLLRFKLHHMIHGHTHRPGVHHFLLPSKNKDSPSSPATRTVLGAWHETGSVLVCEDDKAPELVVYS